MQQVGYAGQGSPKLAETIFTVGSSKEPLLASVPPYSSYPISQRTGLKRRLSDDLEIDASRRVSGNVTSEPVKKTWLEEDRRLFNQNIDERETIPASGK